MTLNIKTAPAALPVAIANAMAKVRNVRLKGTELNLDLEDGTTWTLQTAEATSPVMLRDKAGKLEWRRVSPPMERGKRFLFRTRGITMVASTPGRG